MKPPRKLKNLDFIDFFSVASKLAVQHKRTRRSKRTALFFCSVKRILNCHHDLRRREWCEYPRSPTEANRERGGQKPQAANPTAPQPCYASNLDANPKKPDVLRHLGFFIPIFHSAILVDAKRKKHRVDRI